MYRNKSSFLFLLISVSLGLSCIACAGSDRTANSADDSNTVWSSAEVSSDSASDADSSVAEADNTGTADSTGQENNNENTASANPVFSCTISGTTQYQKDTGGKLFSYMDQAQVTFLMPQDHASESEPAAESATPDPSVFSFTATWDAYYEEETMKYRNDRYTLNVAVHSEDEAWIGEQAVLTLNLPSGLICSNRQQADTYTVTVPVSDSKAPVYADVDGGFIPKNGGSQGDVFHTDASKKGSNDTADLGSVKKGEENSATASSTSAYQEVIPNWDAYTSAHYSLLWQWEPAILSKYKKYYRKNHDTAGWLTVDGTSIDGPVMQTLWDETYYLYRTFEGKDSEVGTYLIDDNCVFGVGTKKDDYQGGEVPGTNIILYGHNLSEGRGFGHLLKYEDEAFCKKHPQIHFDTLYEERTYEVMAVFRSQIYDESYGDVFRYYHFTQADSKKEFQAWYKNIKKMSLYDTGVSAKYGDEFITLSTCAYHTDNGRFAVVAKRIK